MVPRPLPSSCRTMALGRRRSRGRALVLVSRAGARRALASGAGSAALGLRGGRLGGLGGLVGRDHARLALAARAPSAAGAAPAALRRALAGLGLRGSVLRPRRARAASARGAAALAGVSSAATPAAAGSPAASSASRAASSCSMSAVLRRRRPPRLPRRRRLACASSPSRRLRHRRRPSRRRRSRLVGGGAVSARSGVISSAGRPGPAGGETAAPEAAPAAAAGSAALGFRRLRLLRLFAAWRAGRPAPRLRPSRRPAAPRRRRPLLGAGRLLPGGCRAPAGRGHGDERRGRQVREGVRRGGVAVPRRRRPCLAGRLRRRLAGALGRRRSGDRLLVPAAPAVAAAAARRGVSRRRPRLIHVRGAALGVGRGRRLVAGRALLGCAHEVNSFRRRPSGPAANLPR